ncbi:MAG: glucose-6-phosphate isomerase [Planctomycetales bacterium]|nr:glucose-6-phosphate isomerase [Planctomycetales bacterium]
MTAYERITRAGVELDAARMKLPLHAETCYGPLLDRAVKKIAELEAGSLANFDEGRQVGHNWLRDPQQAPVEHRQAIVDSWQQIEAVRAQFVQGGFAQLAWVGIGGSAMAPQLLYDALASTSSTPMHFFDNTDPAGFQRVLEQLDAGAGLAKTMVVVVSKSGGTKETRSGMRVLQQEFQRRQIAWEPNAVAITQPGSALDRQASEWLNRLPIWDWVGGRTSLFSAVGMLPAAICGLGMHELLEGAKEMDAATRVSGLRENPALMLAMLWYHAVEVEGRRNMVILPYCDRLLLLSKYLQQLVMESLGKDGKGISVFGNKGSTDQHSFVQQLREGYADFFGTFICVRKPAADWIVDSAAAANPASGARERLEVSVGDYLAAFQEGTAQALREAGRPSLRLTVDELTPHTLGAIIALYERAVGFYAELIGVNAYHQPGVEAGKKAAEQVLDAQSAVVLALRSSADGATVGELAKQTGVPVELTHDILHRLQVCGRCGVQHIAETKTPASLADCRFASVEG